MLTFCSKRKKNNETSIYRSLNYPWWMNHPKHFVVAAKKGKIPAERPTRTARGPLSFVHFASTVSYLSRTVSTDLSLPLSNVLSLSVTYSKQSDPLQFLHSLVLSNQREISNIFRDQTITAALVQEEGYDQ